MSSTFASNNTNVPHSPATIESPPMTSAGLLDLEKELTCSICTDILYQPLTLLDCLHTFCGSCLKEWFTWQKTAALGHRDHVKNSNPYTCPSCRAAVRETRPNAAVTTLLDMFMKANPSKAKTDAEKLEIAEFYKPGDVVIPTLSHHIVKARQDANGQLRRRRGRSQGGALRESGQRREILREVEDTNLQGDTESPDRGRNEIIPILEDSNEQAPSRRNGSSPIYGTVPRRTGQQSGNEQSRNGNQQLPDAIDPEAITTLDHQRSLRSMISISDFSSNDMEADIFRQIMEDGLLDNIDLSNIDTQTEDLISERIAQAYKTIKRQRQRQRDDASSPRGTQGNDPLEDHQQSRRSDRIASHARPQKQQPDERSTTNLPSSAFIWSSPHKKNRSRQSSSQGISQMSAPDYRRNAGSNLGVHAPESVGHLAETFEDGGNGTLRQKNASETEKDSVDLVAASSSKAQRSGQSLVISNDSTVLDEYSHTSLNTQMKPQTSQLESEKGRADFTETHNGARVFRSSDSVSVQATTDYDNRQHEILESGMDRRPSGVLTQTPRISCRSCLRPNVEYMLHYNCVLCASLLNEDFYALCIRCYRLGRGCLHWFGFGDRVSSNFQRYTSMPGHMNEDESPHKLFGQRFVKQSSLDRSAQEKLEKDEDQSILIRQEGLFCDHCGTNANYCYWKCDECNEGEWGFCNLCVNMGHHCTHPLTAYGWSATPLSPTAFRDGSTAISTEPINYQEMALTKLATDSHMYQISIQTACNVCRSSITVGEFYLHCPTCNDSDYDICMSCYRNLCSTGRIALTLNGLDGWRKCENGHRMLTIVFETTPSLGENTTIESAPFGKRVVARGPVGGFGCDNSDSGNSATPIRGEHEFIQPPSQPAEARLRALWTRVPEDDVTDELTFPRGAIIEQVKEMNQDWCWGVYCGCAGLFPSGFGRAI